VESDTNHVFDLVYHNRGQLTPDGTPFKPDDRPGYSYLRDTASQVCTSPVRLRFNLSQGIQGWWTLAAGESTTLITGTGVGRHTEDRVPLVIARREGQATVYAWCVFLGQEGKGVQLQVEDVKPVEGAVPPRTSAAAVTVKTPSGSWLLVANPAGAPVLARGKFFPQRLGGSIELVPAP
jgi:hypothetical protein